MRIRNIHQREFDADCTQLAALLDSLASDNDRLWPAGQWPAMRFDRPLEVGAQGGHGPIRYYVADYQPGHRITFTFTGPRGFQGGHTFEIETVAARRTLLHHRVEMAARGTARLAWPLLFRPLHDALVEDAFDKVERQLGLTPAPRRWSPTVRLLRRMLGRRRKSPRPAS